MILSTKGRYAVMAMVELARKDSANPLSLALIADKQEIPLAYLEQIFAKLKRAGLVESLRGPGGGYKLAKAPHAMPIADIILASEESMQMTRCGKKIEGCMTPGTRCLTHDLWEGLTDHIHSYLDAISLGDVIDGNIRYRHPELVSGSMLSYSNHLSIVKDAETSSA